METSILFSLIEGVSKNLVCMISFLGKLFLQVVFICIVASILFFGKLLKKGRKTEGKKGKEKKLLAHCFFVY